MGIDGLLLLLAALVTIAILLQRLAARIYLPFAATLLITGFVGSEVMVGMGADLSLDAGTIHDIAVYALVRKSVFASYVGLGLLGSMLAGYGYQLVVLAGN